MDLKQMGETIGLEEDEFLEIVELFIQTAESDIKKLKDAQTQNTPDSAAEAAHSLKGASGNLGFSSLAEVSGKIENEARNGNLENLPDAITTLTSKLEEIKQALL